jgi:hypothetical protein
MNENLKLYAKISLKSVGTWFLVAGLGTLITLITFLICFIGSHTFMGGGSGASHAGQAAILVYIAGFATSDPCGFAVVFGAPLFLTGYFVLAGKIAIQNALYLVWKNKGIEYFEPVIRRIAQRVVSQRVNDTLNRARLRAGLRDANRNDASTKPVQKKVINYALKKVKLDDIDHSQEELTLDEVITKRAVRFISDTAEPGYGLFWILAVLQILLTIVSVAYF